MDSVSRLGGDEFVVVLPDLDTLLGAITVAKRIAGAIASPITLDKGAVQMTASIGITISDHAVSERDLDADRLLREADAAMYQAKSLGGSRTELFDPDNAANNVEGSREGWIRQIRDALDEYRFVLHSQPIVELDTGAVVQYELLLRMRDRDGALIPPLAFLPTAESCGLISEIDDWIITQAAEIAAGGQTAAVNLSAACAGDPRVLDLIERELRHHQTDPASLCSRSPKPR